MKEDRASCAIITDGENYLLQAKDQQHPWSGCGLWSLFGGKIEDGESEEEALRRELEEELPDQLPDLAISRLDFEIDAGGWTWVPFLIKLPFLPSCDSTEGLAIRVSKATLLKALGEEGKETRRGPAKGKTQRIFFPGIAELLKKAFPR